MGAVFGRLITERRARFALAAAAGLGLLVVVLAILQAALLSRALDAVFLESQAPEALHSVFVGLVAVALFRAAALFLSEILSQRAAAETKRALRVRLAARLAARGPLWVAGERTGELAQTLTAGVEAMDGFVAQYLPQVVLALTAPVLVITVVFRTDPLSGFVLLVTGPLVPFFMALVGAKTAERSREQWLALQRLGGAFLDTVTGLATLKAFGRADAAVRALGAAGEALRASTMTVLRIAFLSSMVLELLATVGTALVAVSIGLRLLHGRMEFESGLFVLLLTPEFYRPLRGLGAAWHAGMAGREAGKRIAEILDGEELVPAPRPAPGGSPISTPPRVVFEDVRAAYGGGQPNALDGVSFEVPAGQTVALVGPSGSGKTTTANLLLRFLEPTGGRILVDGATLGSLEPADWRSRMAWLPQRPTLFHGSVLDNLRLGRPDATRDEVWAAAEEASARGFIEDLPEGLDTALGESGLRLSAGQARRIALCRAFLRDPAVVILDEPTAEMDPETEEQLLPALRRLREGRTTLLIAHRLPGVADADRIVVLREGRVEEQGSPAVLLREGGRYARLVEAFGTAT
ncbi:MAG TPA: thiol reductant ABC exporter subunit CydD [Vicinamibacteria bacterium]